jgi:hypothetical protein
LLSNDVDVEGRQASRVRTKTGIYAAWKVWPVTVDAVNWLLTRRPSSAADCPCLCWWESQGKKLEGRAVAIEARSVADRVIAIVQPVEPLRQQPQGPMRRGCSRSDLQTVQGPNH